MNIFFAKLNLKNKASTNNAMAARLLGLLLLTVGFNLKNIFKRSMHCLPSLSTVVTKI